MNQILQGIRAVKFYAWENSISEEISKMRKLELSQIRKFLFLFTVNFSTVYFWPILVVFSSVVIYVQLEGPLTVRVAFLILIFILNTLR